MKIKLYYRYSELDKIHEYNLGREYDKYEQKMMEYIIIQNVENLRWSWFCFYLGQYLMRENISLFHKFINKKIEDFNLFFDSNEGKLLKEYECKNTKRTAYYIAKRIVKHYEKMKKKEIKL